MLTLQQLPQVLWTLDLTATATDGLGPDSVITNITFLQELEALCVTATQGELLLVHSNKEVEEVQLVLLLLDISYSSVYTAAVRTVWCTDWPY